MTLRDFVRISTGNLRRMKLRTFLTSSGVLVAIAAFVSMLSFGAGNQQYVEKQFDELGLLTTMQVYPKDRPGSSDTTKHPVLDEAALERLGAVPGVNLVYPYDAFNVSVKLKDTVVSSKAQSLSLVAIRTKLFSKLRAGKLFPNDSARQVIVSAELLKSLPVAKPESAVGMPLIISVHVSTIDSGLAHIVRDRGETIFQRLRRIHLDSLRRAAYRKRTISTELNAAMQRFVNGFFNARRTIADTLTICAVREFGRVGRLHIEPIIIPIVTAARFRIGGFSGEPQDLFAAMSSGTLLGGPDGSDSTTFSQVTIDFDPKVPYKNVKDSIEAMGYRTFSFAAEFEQVQRIFIYFDLALGMIGLIALFTASLGIVNTMVMSITERRKEIGILKSLGAYEGDIRLLFLVESGVIGVIGTLGGILFGWIITRIASAIAQAYMTNQGMPSIDLFALPYWLVLIALVVGVGVAVLAGFYPAARASRVDPVEALRNE